MARFSKDVRFEVDLTDNHNPGFYTPRAIVLHWWGDPATRPTFDGVVSWFNMPRSRVSAQYVVEAGRITQMVMERHRAWHAGNDWANKYGIGIEVNPRLSAGDYRTTAELVAEIRSRLGALPLQPHSRYTSTACPGTMDLARINREARQQQKSQPKSQQKSQPKAPAPAPARKSTAQLAREVIDGKHGNGEARRRSLGSRYAEVQAEVNRQLARR